MGKNKEKLLNKWPLTICIHSYMKYIIDGKIALNMIRVVWSCGNHDIAWLPGQIKVQMLAFMAHWLAEL